MVTRQSSEQKIKIQASSCRKISRSDRERLVEIALSYYPDRDAMSKTVDHHLRHADSVRLARDSNNVIVGFSVASLSRRLTPFHSRPINLLYQRMLYLSPDVLYRGLGKRLLIATFIDLLGPLWIFRRFANVCRTQNPVVARMMDMHTVSYPHYAEKLPDEIRIFAESLLPMLGANSLDQQCRLLGTLDVYKDRDYTDIWNRYLQIRNNSYETLMLDSAFSKNNGRIVNSGAFVFMIAYSKPLQFIRYSHYYPAFLKKYSSHRSTRSTDERQERE